MADKENTRLITDNAKQSNNDSKDDNQIIHCVSQRDEKPRKQVKRHSRTLSGRVVCAKLLKTDVGPVPVVDNGSDQHNREHKVRDRGHESQLQKRPKRIQRVINTGYKTNTGRYYSKKL